MTGIEPHHRGRILRPSRKEQRSIDRHNAELEAAKREIEAIAVAKIHETDCQAAVESNKVARVIGLHKQAMIEVASYSVAEQLAMDMAPSAIHRIAAIGARMVVEVDEALDDGSHKITGRSL